MNSYDIMLIGHVSNDTVYYKGELSRFTGGAAYFSAFAAKRSNARVLVVTRMAEADFGLLDGMKKEGIEVLAIPSPQTTSIENIFETDDLDQRKVSLLSQAELFSLEDIPEAETKIYVLAGLFKGEIPPSIIEPLSQKGKIGLDLQSMLRTSEKGEFSFKDWDEKSEYLPSVTYLKADSLESEVITGTADREKAAEILNEMGAEEVMITHSSEVILYNGKEFARAFFNPGNLSGRTGRGDTCFISYMTRRLSHGIGESLSYAASLTSIKMEKPGPFSGNVDDVLARMKKS